MLKEIIIDFNFSLSSFNVIFNKDLYMDILLRCARLSCDKTFFFNFWIFSALIRRRQRKLISKIRKYILKNYYFRVHLWLTLVKIGLPSKTDVQTWNLLFVQKINLKDILPILPYAKPKFQAKLWYHSFDVSYLVWLLRSVFWWLANSDMTSGSISNSSFFLFNKSSNMESLSSKLPTIKVVSSFGKDSLPISESIISMSSWKHKIEHFMKICWC